MLNPSRKKKRSKRNRTYDLLAFPNGGLPLEDEGSGSKHHRYEPLELSDGCDDDDDDNDLSFPSTSYTKTSRCNCWKIAFLLSMTVLIPLLLYVVLDESGVVIVINNQRNHSSLSSEKSQPIITGVGQPNNTSTTGTPEKTESLTQPRTKQSDPTAQPPADAAAPDANATHNVVAVPQPTLPLSTGEESSSSDGLVETDCEGKYYMDYAKALHDLKTNNVFCPSKMKPAACQCPPTLEPSMPPSGRVAPDEWQAALDANTKVARLAATLSDDLDVVLFGDSITEHLTGKHLGVPTQEWTGYKAVFDKILTRTAQYDGNDESGVNGLALGISGDRCAQLLYRLRNGELPPNLTPKVWWLLIGTNDLNDSCSPKAILMGIINIVKEIQTQRPKSTIVINGLLPRPRNSQGTLMGLLWTKIDWINHRLQCYASDWENVEYFDAAGIFVEKNGKNLKSDHYAKDWIHPSLVGTSEWVEAIAQTVQQLIHS